jgi:hypothetical protein
VKSVKDHRIPLRTMAAATAATFAILFGMALLVASVRAQAKPVLTIEEDCQAFAIAPDNKIAYAVRRIHGVKKLIVERDDIWVSTADGRKKRILEGEKWMPKTEKASYSIQSLTWSPDSRRIAVNMAMSTISKDLVATSAGANVILLLDEEGREINIAGNGPKPTPPPATPSSGAAQAKPGFSSSEDAPSSEERPGPAPRASIIEDSSNAAWLADGGSVVYLSAVQPFQISRMRPSDGKKTVLFEGHAYQAVAWDTSRNQAFAIGQGVRGALALIQLDLVHETLRELAKLSSYESSLVVSSSGRKVGYFIDGDTMEVRDVEHPEKPIDVRTGNGRFEFNKDGTRVLLKRGPERKSSNLVWITLADGNFRPFLHDLLFHNFEITPDGNSVAVTEPGKEKLMIYRLEN